MGHCSQTLNPGPETQHHGTLPPCTHQALCRNNSHRTSNCSSLPQETSPAKRGCCLGSTCRAIGARACPATCVHLPPWLSRVAASSYRVGRDARRMTTLVPHLGCVRASFHVAACPSGRLNQSCCMRSQDSSPTEAKADLCGVWRPRPQNSHSVTSSTFSVRASHKPGCKAVEELTLKDRQPAPC